MFLKISLNSQENTCARVSFLIRLHSCEFYEISKNTFFTEHLFRLLHSIIILLNYQEQRSWGRVSKTSKSCEKWAYWSLYFFWLLHFHTRFAGSHNDITFSRIVCSILYSKNVFPFKILFFQWKRQWNIRADRNF